MKIDSPFCLTPADLNRKVNKTLKKFCGFYSKLNSTFLNIFYKNILIAIIEQDKKMVVRQVKRHKFEDSMVFTSAIIYNKPFVIHSESDLENVIKKIIKDSKWNNPEIFELTKTQMLSTISVRLP